MSAAPAPRPSLLRHGEFLKLWSAETISQFGTQVSLLAIPLIAALILDVSPFAFGLLSTIEFLPFILISLPAGVWVDRLPRRPILIIGDLGRGLALLSIPIAFALHALTIWQLYVVGFINGCLTVFFDVSYQAYLPSLVEREDILEGNAKLEISRSAAQIAGPGLAGFLIGIVTAPIAVILDALSYLASALLVFAIRKPEPPPVQAKDGETRPSMRSEIAAGLRYVVTHDYLRAIAACTGISNFFGTLVFAILVLYLVRDLSFSPEVIGLAFSVGAVGSLLGALAANRLGSRRGVGPTIVISALFFGPSAVLVAIAPREAALPFVAGMTFIGSCAGVIYNINQVSFRQAITPPRMQGRMNATMRFIVWGTIPLGSALGGFLGGAIGLRQTIWIGAAGGLFSFVPLVFSPLWSLRTMPEPVTDEAAIDVLGEAIDETPRPLPLTPRPAADEEAS
jgi:MFS family permease